MHVGLEDHTIIKMQIHVRCMHSIVQERK